MTLRTLTPTEAKALIESGAVAIDVREPGEFAGEHIAGSVTHPLSRLAKERPAVPAGNKVVFLCQSGARTGANAAALASSTDCEAFILEGGLSAWKKAGLPVERAGGQSVSIFRQVLMVAGTLILLGAILGALVSPIWHLLSAFVGGGLLFAGITDICPMARVLNKMPWNQVRTSQPAAKTGVAA